MDEHLCSHYLFKDIRPEFVVDVHNLWDPHPVQTQAFNITKENYQIMAETERGPVVVLHSNTCAVQFNLDRKYPETVQILKNYLEQKLYEISYSKMVHMTLQDAINERRVNRNVNNDERVTKLYEKDLK